MSQKLIVILSFFIIFSCSKSNDVNKIIPKPITKGNSYSLNLGLPELEIPEVNPMTKSKISLGDKLFNDTRFSLTKQVSCSTCHDLKKGLTDNLKVSKGINDLTGTRNAPTIINAAFNTTQFWDGRSPDLEDQATHPFVNPVEMGLIDHAPILEIVRNDPEYNKAFREVFSKSGDQIEITHVVQAIAAFERSLIAGNSRFDRWYFKGDKILSEKEIEGFKTFVGNGRCISCHVIEESTALFMDNRFHNVGVGINKLSSQDITRLTEEFMTAKLKRAEVDIKVLKEAKSSELGRFAVTRNLSEMGAFKTPTLRNIGLTAPYMHDGSLATLEEVVEHYNRGGASADDEKITDLLSGGIKPLNLSQEEKENLVAFMKSLTSQRFEQ